MQISSDYNGMLSPELQGCAQKRNSDQPALHIHMLCGTVRKHAHIPCSSNFLSYFEAVFKTASNLRINIPQGRSFIYLYILTHTIIQFIVSSDPRSCPCSLSAPPPSTTNGARAVGCRSIHLPNHIMSHDIMTGVFSDSFRQHRKQSFSVVLLPRHSG